MVRIRASTRKVLQLCHSKEEQFAQEFIRHDGLNELIQVIFDVTGNTLAVRWSGHHLVLQPFT